MKEHYDNIDGLRTISCLCIIAMHIKENADYNLHPMFAEIVKSWTHFVPLFLMISGFGMFCGYYEKFRNGGGIDLNDFYTKRYKKFLPFFITLILVDVLINRNFNHVIEGITEATLVFGLLPNNQPDVIGVSWTLGIIFLFYMLFPFVVYLCWNNRRSTITFIFSIALSLFCSFYYFTEAFVIEGFTDRHNILYCSPWILGGGYVYLNREVIKSFVLHYRRAWLAGCIALTIAWYSVPDGTSGVIMLKNLILFLAWLMYAISVESKVLSNKVTKYLSGISLELYLAQMVIFRAIEKVKGLYIFGHGEMSFIVTWSMVLIGLILFIEVWKRVRSEILKRILRQE